ncbi:hypothetical protein LBMAG53_22090 [Planctomycetota bacterium]|nr:hypothetical protein LBMAG53_22090 [Planctomycetota bacterium]
MFDKNPAAQSGEPDRDSSESTPYELITSGNHTEDTPEAFETEPAMDPHEPEDQMGLSTVIAFAKKLCRDFSVSASNPSDLIMLIMDGLNLSKPITKGLIMTEYSPRLATPLVEAHVSAMIDYMDYTENSGSLLIYVPFRNEPSERTREVIYMPLVRDPAKKATVTNLDLARQVFDVMLQSGEFFRRGDQIVRQFNSGETISLETINAANFCTTAYKYMMFVKKDKKYIVVEEPCLGSAIAGKVLKSHERMRLPEIKAVSNSPVIVNSNGRLDVLNMGYDGPTQILMTQQHDIPEVPLSESVEFIKELVEDFDFVSDGDRSRALSFILAPCLRQSGIGPLRAPFYLIEGNRSQAGKGVMVSIAAAANMIDFEMITIRDSGLGSFDRSLDRCLINGDRFIAFDNLRLRVNSTHLEALLTPSPVGTLSGRPFRGAEVPIDPTKTIICATTNSGEVTPDLMNRSLIIRIRKRDPGYIYRMGSEPGDWVKERGPYSLGCVLAVWREWQARGCPRAVDDRHSFVDWMAIMNWVVTEIFHEAPLLDGHEEAIQRTASPAENWLREMALSIVRHGLTDQRWTASALAQHATLHGIFPSGARPWRDEKQGNTQVGQLMRQVFETGDRCVIDGSLEIVRTTGYNPAQGRLERFYQIQQVA